MALDGCSGWFWRNCAARSRAFFLRLAKPASVMRPVSVGQHVGVAERRCRRTSAMSVSVSVSRLSSVERRRCSSVMRSARLALERAAMSVSVRLTGLMRLQLAARPSVRPAAVVASAAERRRCSSVLRLQLVESKSTGPASMGPTSPHSVVINATPSMQMPESYLSSGTVGALGLVLPSPASCVTLVLSAVAASWSSSLLKQRLAS